LMHEKQADSLLQQLLTRSFLLVVCSSRLSAAAAVALPRTWRCCLPAFRAIDSRRNMQPARAASASTARRTSRRMSSESERWVREKEKANNTKGRDADRCRQSVGSSSFVCRCSPLTLSLCQFKAKPSMA
jgi:hypothetical protein